ncbi:hypothetical protein AW27_015490 [Streptomyces sp. PCS3-D2]|uniref:hypothetical protein n=1 Tax=Streptomyces sp. PCS3-D2 TaxID=1460244 RepID=UPI0004526E5B|nr:hypothetical protein [Streptomyces sp. PCS3-D2]WKV72811.1 hypothetical protein AW27_015490 [Streptomyces sp. PCS3-D2]
MLLLELALHSLMDLALWIGGKGLDRARSARRVAAFRRGEPVTLRCRYRTGARASGMQPGKITLLRSAAVLDGPGAKALRLAGPSDAAIGGGRGGTALTCNTIQGEKAELLVLTWDSTMVGIIAESIDAGA